MRVREQPHIARMVRTVDDDLVKPEALNAPPQMLQAASRLQLARQRGKLVGDHAHRPRIAFAGYRSTSGGVLLSLPGQNGQLSTNSGMGCTTRCVASSSGRLARSVAMMTHSLVKKFWRSSGM